MVTREQICSNEFNVLDVVNNAWDVHLMAPRDCGCFAGDESDHEHPALSWLLFRFAGALTELEGISMEITMDRLVINLATGSYLIFDQVAANHYFVMHTEIR